MTASAGPSSGSTTYSTFALTPDSPQSARGDGEHHAHLTKDDMGLEDLGYRPELRRNFSKLETFGVAFSIM